jgi:hypothetical protein
VIYVLWEKQSNSLNKKHSNNATMASKGFTGTSPAMPAGAGNMYDYTGYGLELKDGAACVEAPSISLVENRYDYTLVFSALASLRNCAL